MAMTMASTLPIQIATRPALSLSRCLVNLQSASLYFRRNLAALERKNEFTVLSKSGLDGVESRRWGSVARGTGVTSGTSTSESDLSVEELKAKGDSYFATDKRPIILFDGVCNLCNGAVNFVLDNDLEGKLRFAALQSEAGKALLTRSGRAQDDISSVVLVDKDRAYVKSEAVIQTCSYLGFPFPPLAMAASIVPLFVRDVAYDQVADNRYSIFGQTIACRFTDPRFEERFVG